MMTPPPVTILNPNLPADPDSVARAIAALVTIVDGARIRTEAGESIDLAGFDAGVRALCTAVGHLDPAAGQRLVPSLVGLSQALDTLAAQLKRRKHDADEQARRRAEGTPAPARVAETYRSTNQRGT